MSIVQILQLIFLLICLFFPFIINILIIPTLLYRFWEKYSFLKFYFWHYNQTTSYGKKISMLLLSSSFSFLSVPPSSSSLSVPMCSASSVRWVAQNVLTALHLSLTHMQLLVVHIHPPLIHIHLTSALCLTGWRGKGWGGGSGWFAQFSNWNVNECQRNTKSFYQFQPWDFILHYICIFLSLILSIRLEVIWHKQQ